MPSGDTWSKEEEEEERIAEEISKVPKFCLSGCKKKKRKAERVNDAMGHKRCEMERQENLSLTSFTEKSVALFIFCKNKDLYNAHYSFWLLHFNMNQLNPFIFLVLPPNSYYYIAFL